MATHINYFKANCKKIIYPIIPFPVQYYFSGSPFSFFNPSFQQRKPREPCNWKWEQTEGDGEWHQQWEGGGRSKMHLMLQIKFWEARGNTRLTDGWAESGAGEEHSEEMWEQRFCALHQLIIYTYIASWILEDKFPFHSHRKLLKIWYSDISILRNIYKIVSFFLFIIIYRH